MNTTTILRNKGQFTIPFQIREELDIGENDVLTILSLGKKGFFVIPRKLKTMELLKESAALTKKNGVTFKAMLDELDKVRHGTKPSTPSTSKNNPDSTRGKAHRQGKSK